MEVISKVLDSEINDDLGEEIENPVDSTPEDPPVDNKPGEDSEFDKEEPVVEPKFKLTDATKDFGGTKVHRIVAVKDFGNIRAGHLGGWIEKEENLTHAGDCWIYDEGIVLNDACIRDNAQVRDEAVVSGYADVGRDAKVLDQAFVTDEVLVTDKAMVRDNAVICDESCIMGNALILNNSFVRNAVVNDHVCIQDNAVIIDATLNGHAYVCDDAVVDSDVMIGGYSRLDRKSKLIQSEDYSAAFIRCSLLGIETDEPYRFVPDEHDKNLFHVTVYPDEPLRIAPQPIDPSSNVRIEYTEMDITDDPLMHWGEEFIGQEDTLTIVLSNPFFSGYERRYTVQVEIVEKPVDPEVPSDLVSLDIGGILTDTEGTVVESTEFPETYRFYGHVGQRFKFEPILMDERAEWRLEWQNINITGLPLAPTGQFVNSEFLLTVSDSEDPARYRLYIILVTITEPPRANLDILGIESGNPNMVVKQESDRPVYLLKGKSEDMFQLKPILQDKAAAWKIYWMEEDISDAPVHIPFATENEMFTIVVYDPNRPMRKKTYIVLVSIEE